MQATVILLSSLLFAVAHSSVNTEATTKAAESNGDVETGSSDEWNGPADWNRLYTLLRMGAKGDRAGAPSTAGAASKRAATTNPLMAFQERRVSRGGFDSLMGYGFTGFDRRRRVFDSLHGFGFDGFY